jgi:phosphatidate cytidylyltransferase
VPDSVVQMFEAVPPALAWGLGGVAGTLIVATLIMLALPVLKPSGDWTELRHRIWSWWVIIALVVVAMAFGWVGVTVLFAAVAFIALREFLSLAPLRREDRLIVLWAYLTIPLSFGLIVLDQYGIYLVAIPVWFFLITPFLMALAGQTRAYLATVATITWGVIVCVYNLGAIPLLMRVPAEEAPAGAAGMVFLLLLATQANDVLQYCCGKLFGRHKILPTVSPNKTWEGFLGGWVLTAALIWFLAPVLHAPDAFACGAGSLCPAAGRVRRRCHHERGQARPRGQGHQPTDPRPRRRAGPDRQPDLYRPPLFPPAGLLCTRPILTPRARRRCCARSS